MLFPDYLPFLSPRIRRGSRCREDAHGGINPIQSTPSPSHTSHGGGDPDDLLCNAHLLVRVAKR